MKKAIKYIDIHGHINFPEYDADKEEVIKRADEAGVGMITVGTDIESSKKAIEIAETHENMWATVGIHPTEIVGSEKLKVTGNPVIPAKAGIQSQILDSDNNILDSRMRGNDKNDALAQNNSSAATQDESPPIGGFRHDPPAGGDMRKSALVVVGEADQELVSTFQDLRRLALHPKVVAIGECGLDYFHCQEADIPAQIEAFEKHIAIANEARKPLMLHVRNKKNYQADSSVIPAKAGILPVEKPINAILNSNFQFFGNAYKDALDILKKSAKVPFNFHFFAGSMEDMKNIIEVGGAVSFTGVLTFTHDYDELIKTAPLDRIMSETDCPYVSPVPYRGKRSEPAYVIEVVKAIARIRGEDEEKVRIALIKNAENFFSLTRFL